MLLPVRLTAHTAEAVRLVVVLRLQLVGSVHVDVVSGVYQLLVWCDDVV